MRHRGAMIRNGRAESFGGRASMRLSRPPPPSPEAFPLAVPVRIPTPAGHALQGCLFAANGPRRGDVVVHSALATPKEFYGRFASGLAGQGFRVLTYDYGGFGASAGPIRGDSFALRVHQGVDLDQWILNDLPAASAYLRHNDPAPRQLAVGHSFGGQAAALAPISLLPDAMVFVGVQRGWLGGFSWLSRLRFGFAMSVLMPMTTAVFGYLPGWAGLGHDLPKGVVDQWRRWCARADYFFSEHPEYRERIAAYQGSIYALSFTDDRLAPLGNTRWMLKQFSSARIWHQHVDPQAAGLPGVGHHGLFRPQMSSHLWPAVADFFAPECDAAFSGVPGIPFVPTPSLQDRDVLPDLIHGRD